MLFFVITFSSGLLCLLLALPMMLGRVGINPLYGFRTRKSMSDPRIWDLANRAAGRALMWAGGVTMLGSPSLLLIDNEDVQVPGMLVLVTIPVLAATAYSFWYLSRIPDSQAP